MPTVLSRNVSILTIVTAFTLLGLGGLLPLLLGADATLASHTECSDGRDNDDDNKIDYPQDEDCQSLDDDFEGIGQSGLFLSITDGREQVAPNGSLTYILTLRQQREALRDVDLDLHLPHQANIVSASDGGVISDGRIHWDNLTVQRNFTKHLTVYINVNPNAAEDLLIVARAIAEGTEATDTTIVKRTSALPLSDQFDIRISDGKQFAKPGTNLHYTITVKNLTNADQTTDVRVGLARMLTVNDTDPSAEIDSSKIVWPKVTFGAHEEREFTYSVHIRERTEDYVRIAARATAGIVSDVDDTIIRSGLEPNALSVKIDDNRKTVERGEILTYTVRVKNESSDLVTNGNVNVSLPVYSEFVDATEGGVWDGSNVRWSSLAIAPNDERVLTYKVRVRSDSPLDHPLMVSVSSHDAEDTDTTEVVKRSNEKRGLRAESKYVLFKKTANTHEVVPGGTIRYTIFVQNILLNTMNDAVVTDRFDPTLLTVVENGDATISANGLLQWRLPKLLPGEIWQKTYTMRVSRALKTGEIVSNVATITGEDVATATLDEKVAVIRSGVLGSLPRTGSASDLLFLLAGLPLAIGASIAQRKAKLS